MHKSLVYCLAFLFCFYSNTGFVSASNSLAQEELLPTISLGRINKQRCIYRKELKKNAQLRFATLFGAGSAVGILSSYMLYYYFYASSNNGVEKKSLSDIHNDSRSWDDLRKDILAREYLQRQEDLHMSNLLCNHIKRGIGYACGSIATGYIIWLFTNIQDKIFDYSWVDYIYSSDSYGYRRHAMMVYRQIHLVHTAVYDLRKEFIELGNTNYFTDFIENKELSVNEISDAYVGFVLALENFIAYIAESIALLNESERSSINPLFEQTVQSCIADVEMCRTNLILLIQCTNQDSLVQCCSKAMGRIKVIMRHLGNFIQVVGENVYGLTHSETNQ